MRWVASCFLKLSGTLPCVSRCFLNNFARTIYYISHVEYKLSSEHWNSVIWRLTYYKELVISGCHILFTVYQRRATVYLASSIKAGVNIAEITNAPISPRLLAKLYSFVLVCYTLFVYESSM